MHEQIIYLLRLIPGGSAETIAQDMSAVSGRDVPQPDIQAALHQLDDAGRVLMRNGWYQLTQAERAKI